MFSKLSFRNMKRSVSDYAIYFMTLMLAVCLFYTFNTITAQQVMLDLSTIQNESMGYLNDLIMMASGIVSLIFCVLCVFANQFLVKRRKREFGLYMSLGMGKFDVSKLLILETLFLASISLVVGIGLGVLVSQGMAVFTSSLFNVPIKEYQFMFSMEAAGKTALFFGLVFLFVMIFNVFAVSKYTLISLLTSAQKGEVQRLKNPLLNAILSLLSIILLVSGYTLLLNTSLTEGFTKIILAGVLIIVGCILFYFSAITLFLSFLSKNKTFYFRGINSFNVRQIRAKINSGMVAIISISFLLCFTVTILTNAMSYKKTMEQELSLVAPFDASVTIYNSERAKEFDIDTMIREIGLDMSKHDYAIANIYDPAMNANEILLPYAEGSIKRDLLESHQMNFFAITYSDYLNIIKLQGKKAVPLKENETLILTNMSEAQQSLINLTNAVNQFTIGGRTLSLSTAKYQLAAIESETLGRLLACFVIPDDLANELGSSFTMINLQYTEEIPELNAAYEKRFDYMLGPSVLSDDNFYARGITKTQVFDEVTGMTGNLLYVGIYLGIVFLIAAGAVLGLRLLSDASDEQERYQIIRRIGANDRLVNRSVLLQVVSYFGVPLILAIPNSIVISTFITNQLYSTAVGMPILPALVTALVLFLLYGGYFLITYFGYKKIVSK